MTTPLKLFAHGAALLVAATPAAPVHADGATDVEPQDLLSGRRLRPAATSTS
jgi:hypothetical protein